jgi:hypothetical protein
MVVVVVVLVVLVRLVVLVLVTPEELVDFQIFQAQHKEIAQGAEVVRAELKLQTAVMLSLGVGVEEVLVIKPQRAVVQFLVPEREEREELVTHREVVAMAELGVHIYKEVGVQEKSIKTHLLVVKLGHQEIMALETVGGVGVELTLEIMMPRMVVQVERQEVVEVELEGQVVAKAAMAATAAEAKSASGQGDKSKKFND